MAQSTRASRVVVTGASAGIGRATAVAFARRGCRIALLARSEAGLEGARHNVEAVGGEVLVIPTDVADPNAVRIAADRVASEWGGIDVWVNNAMVTVFGPADRIPADEWRRVADVNFLGSVYGTLAALHHMRQRNAGTIVQIGSALAYRSIPLQAPYCATKFAVRGFLDSLRAELLHDGSRVRLTMVQLPGVNTPQFSWSRTHMSHRHRPVGAVFEPEAVAEAIVKAAEEAPRELWVGKPAILAILGAMIAPGLLDRQLARSAYGQQMSSTPAEGPDILFVPSPEDRGTRGAFSSEARERVSHAGSTAMRSGLGLAAIGVILGSVLLTARASARRLEGRCNDERRDLRQRLVRS